MPTFNRTHSVKSFDITAMLSALYKSTGSWKTSSNITFKSSLVTNYRAHVENPELILSTIALHAVFVLFSKFMKKAIDNSTMGMLQVILTEILASFMFVACIFEKGLWYQNVNENYFHVATAAQFIYFVTFLPGKSNPLGLIQQHGPGVQV